MLSTTIHSAIHHKKCLYAFTFFLIFYLICTETSLLGYDELSINLIKPVTSDWSSFPNETKPDRQPKILLVSAFFPLKKSKHSQEDYANWLSNFIGSITTPIYFYTTPSLAATILEKRGSHPIHINTSFISPFDVPPLQGLKDAYKHLHSLDREAFLHNPELYAVWNAKPWLLDSAVQQLGREGNEYDFAFWNDAGSFRSDHHYSKWPDPKRVEEVWQAGISRVKATGDTQVAQENLLFFPIRGTFEWLRRYWREDDGPVDAEISEGSFFGGPPETISWWSRVFYTYHDYYLGKGYFIGKDQTLINSLFLLFPSRIIGVWYSDPAARADLPYFDTGSMGSCGNTWFYYQFFMASDDERRMMREKWMTDLEERIAWPWKSWKWWLKRQECKLVRVVYMRYVLNDAFGKGWGVRKTVAVNSEH
ncbi:hypothetical protein D9756_005619 [Leucocoprinus leucothites]|uniref:Uncharacterized protein n=1 Tax=Leucocoprinus leucothites TaxID=201217 RepID=A0A8H5FZT1_9AGAR|nr:hypothetical protein D9756_005619 [Leucoagaricus leucothites]